jgi:hypothetical protein
MSEIDDSNKRIAEMIRMGQTQVTTHPAAGYTGWDYAWPDFRLPENFDKAMTWLWEQGLRVQFLPPKSISQDIPGRKTGVVIYHGIGKAVVGEYYGTGDTWKAAFIDALDQLARERGKR